MKTGWQVTDDPVNFFSIFLATSRPDMSYFLICSVYVIVEELSCLCPVCMEASEICFSDILLSLLFITLKIAFQNLKNNKPGKQSIFNEMLYCQIIAVRICKCVNLLKNQIAFRSL